MARHLEGRVAIVTGAGRGLGREEALALAAEGAKVVVNDLGVSLAGDGQDQTPAQEVVELIRKGGGEAITDGSDISNWQAAKGLVDLAYQKFGRLDIVVNARAGARPATNAQIATSVTALWARIRERCARS